MEAAELELALPLLREWVAQRRDRWRAALEELVRCESPSGDQAGLSDCLEIVRRLFAATGATAEWGPHQGGEVPWLRLRWGQGPEPGLLLLGHLDTVWDRGAFQPLFEVAQDRVSGPGVFDMKGGVVVALAALEGLREQGAGGRLTLLLTGDEEVGSQASRQLIELEARRSSAVLVLEPPLGRSVKVARKGTGGYRITVRGRAAHAGLDPELGVNALLGIAPLVTQVAALSRPELGTTVSPTRLRGGTRTNVIPAEAHLDLDVRFGSASEAVRVDDAVHQLLPGVPGAQLEVTGGINRPPFEAQSSRQLFALAQEVARHLEGLELVGAAVGGASDGNFTAALGVPTLDGMGIVGGNAHAQGEWADLASIPERAGLLAGCIAALWRTP
ncbi:MAG: M20 family metallopeptidase [Candidatus Dormibacteria bacterium]